MIAKQLQLGMVEPNLNKIFVLETNMIGAHFMIEQMQLPAHLLKLDEQM